MSKQSYLLFHSLVELFSVVVACAIFFIVWNSRRFWQNSYFLIVGIAYLFVGAIDTVHLLAYKGMNVIPGLDANPATQLWICARYLEAGALLSAPLALRWKVRPRPVLLGGLGLFTLTMLSIFYWGVFPDCFIDGTGLTSFKIYSELVISGMVAGAIGLLLWKRTYFDTKVLILTIGSLVFTILAELSFTTYVSVFGWTNFLGHILKVISFYLIYKAIIETGLTQPYVLMFRDLTRANAIVRQSEEKFQELFATMSSGVLMYEAIDDGEDFVILDMNAASGRITNNTKEELVGMRLTEAFPAVEEAGLLDAFRRVWRTGVCEDLPVSKYSDGRISLWYKGHVFKLSTGEIAAIYDDVTEMMETQETLRHSEERYRAIVEDQTEMVCRFLPGSTLTFVNDACCRYFQKTREELIGTDFIPAIPEEDQAAVKEHFASFGPNQPVATHEHRIIAPDGEIRWLQWANRAIMDGDGKIVEFQGAGRDITQRKWATEKIAGLAKFPSENPSPVMRIASDGAVLYANPASLGLMRQWDCNIGRPVPAQWQTVVDNAMKTSTVVSVEENLDGQIFSLRVVPVSDAGYVNLYGLDITERKEATEKVAELARFPAENPSPVMRIASDGAVLYANPASLGLMRQWDCNIGRQVPAKWQAVINDAMETSTVVSVEENLDGQIFNLRVVPVSDGGYVNLYGLDITNRRQSEQALQLSHQFLEIANRHSDMQPLLDEFIAEVRTYTGCQAVGIRILDADNTIPYKATEGFDSEFLALENDLSIETSNCLCAQVIRGNIDSGSMFCTAAGSHCLNNITEFLETLTFKDKDELRGTCEQAGFQTCGLIPIRIGNHSLGLIHVADPRPGLLQPEMIAALEDTALQLGTALQRVWAEEALQQAKDELEQRVQERTFELGETVIELQGQIAERKRLEQEVLNISELERQRIGQDLHDSLGQMLSGLTCMSQALRRKLEKRSIAEASEAGKIEKLLTDSVNLTRSLAHGLAPKGLDPDSLVLAMRELAANMQAMFLINCQFQCDEPVPVNDNHIATNLYRIAQEAANNAARHSMAESITISLSNSDGHIVLEIADDGMGLNPAAVKGDGIGLRVMEYRASAIGAQFKVDTAPGGGTVVTATLKADSRKKKVKANEVKRHP